MLDVDALASRIAALETSEAAYLERDRVRAAPLDIATAACVVDSRSAFYAACPGSSTPTTTRSTP